MGISISNNVVGSGASIGDALGTVSISGPHVGTPVWSLMLDGNGQFSINAATGVVTVDSALTPGGTSIRVKAKGIKPVQMTTFSITINETSLAPVWVPESAKIHIDLVNVRAWTEADGEVDVSTLIGEDVGSVAAWGMTTGYNVANLGADGYTIADDIQVALTSSLLAKVLAGATLRFKFRKGSNGVDGSFVMVSAGETDKAVELGFNVGAATNGKMQAYSWSGPFDMSSGIDYMNKGEGGINVAALTTIPAGRFEFTANGHEAVAGAVTAVEYPTAGADQIVMAIISLRNSDSLQEITAFDALPSVAGLAELSA